ncbi:hypothetical protein TGRH88_081890 [Toxoplasma gondii]|uniref:Uncharacterized protein n=1 Tax=Toxoplasma gondii TaxID=5811 RepID=A0A7J6K5Z9_TOXGO|nr:hypothetical protein TGRH88_081890 [Toxoplasma gondii]
MGCVYDHQTVANGIRGRHVGDLMHSLVDKIVTTCKDLCRKHLQLDELKVQAANDRLEAAQCHRDSLIPHRSGVEEETLGKYDIDYHHR